MEQQSVQDERAFLESIKAVAGEADIQGMTLEDALCLVWLTGLKDNRLWEKLSELETPTLPAFAVLIDAYMHSKATAGSSAAAAGAVGRQQNKGGNKNKNNNNNTGNRPGLSENEKKRRSKMKGKCYRCGSPDHMANNSSVAKDIKCKRCNGTGHTQAAVSRQDRLEQLTNVPLRTVRTTHFWLRNTNPKAWPSQIMLWHSLVRLTTIHSRLHQHCYD